MKDKELTTYQKLLLTVNVNQAGMSLPTVIMNAKILAECIDENKHISEDDYYGRLEQLNPRERASS